MTESNAPFDGLLIRSPNIDYFRDGDDFYVYHNLFGYILKMSEDLVEFIEYFKEPRAAMETMEALDGRFSDDMIGEFANVLALQSCLLDPERKEESRMLLMIPMRARWLVVHEPAEGPVTLYSLDHATKSHIRVVELSAWDSQLWRWIDGETKVEDLVEKMRGVEGSPTSGVEDLVLVSLSRLIHCDMQVLKLSTKPASTFKHRRHGTPPYLISSMPYEKITASIRGAATPSVSFQGMQLVPIDDELLARDGAENRFGTLFSKPHSALGGETYGGALLNWIDAKQALPQPLRILEVGGGPGDMANAFLNKLKESRPELYAQTTYTLFASSELDGDWQKAKLSGHPCASFMVGDPMKLRAVLEGEFDLVLCNEFAADLDAAMVRKLSPEIEEEDEDEEGEESSTNGKQKGRDTFIGEGDSVHVIFKYALPLEDSPSEFYLNIGAIRLLEQIDKVLSPDGQAVLIEFGEMFHYPVRTVEDGGVSFSLHFGHLAHVAKRLKLTSEFDYLMEALGMQRDTKMLATTRSQYKALRHFFAAQGGVLERRAYTQEEFEGLLTQLGLGDGELQDIAYEPLEDRALGLVTHSMKVLRLSRKEAVEL